MQESDFNSEIRKTWQMIKETLKIGRTIVRMVSLPVDEEFRDVALEPSSTYSDIYRVGLSRSNYNILLYDYGYFQFSWESKRSWRLAYLPNPWITGVLDAEKSMLHWESMEDLGDITKEDADEFVAEIPHHGAVPFIRFEYAPSQYKEVAHPAAHFHIGRSTDNRWATSMAVGPYSFSMLIFKQYYSRFWDKNSRFVDESVEKCIEEEFLLSLDRCQLVHEFSATERRVLHFGRSGLNPVMEMEVHPSGSAKPKLKPRP